MNNTRGQTQACFSKILNFIEQAYLEKLDFFDYWRIEMLELICDCWSFKSLQCLDFIFAKCINV